MTRHFGLGKREYIIESEFGTLRGVAQEEAELFEHVNKDSYALFTILPERRRIPGYFYIPSMVLAVCMVIVGLRYLFGG